MNERKRETEAMKDGGLSEKRADQTKTEDESEGSRRREPRIEQRKTVFPEDTVRRSSRRSGLYTKRKKVDWRDKETRYIIPCGI